MKKKLIIGIMTTVVLVGGLAIGVILVRQNQDKRSEAASAGAVSCPIEPGAGKTIVAFDGNLVRADWSTDLAVLDPVTTNIAPGNYTVTLVSYDNDHPGDNENGQEEEVWLAELYSSAGELITQTNIIDDLPEADVWKTQVVNTNFEVTEAATSVVAKQPLWPNPWANSIIPVCAVFETQALATPTPTPSPSPLPTPTPESGGVIIQTQGSITVACNRIDAYTTSNTKMSDSQLTALSAGDTVRFVLSCTSSSGTLDTAIYSINGVNSGVVTDLIPGTNNFYYDYTIGSGDIGTGISVYGWVHHSDDLWF